MGRPSPECRSRLTFDRSPVRESRTPGSARGAGGNSRSYRDQRRWMHPQTDIPGVATSRKVAPLIGPKWAHLPEHMRAVVRAHAELPSGSPGENGPWTAWEGPWMA